MAEEQKVPIEQAEPPSEGVETKGETPKEIAKTMLIDRREVDEIAKETGLKKRSIWALKGALARAGKIPKRAEIEKQKLIGEEVPGVGMPFRREKSAPELVYEICEKYGVRDRAMKIIVDRCKRVPGGVIHPGDFERLLMRLDTGLKKRDEAMLIAEEYELALEAQKIGGEEFRRGYYATRRPTERGGGAYYPEERYREEYPSYRYEREYPHYDRYGRRLPPEYGGRPEVSRRDLEEFQRNILDAVRKEKEEDKFDKMFGMLKGHSEDIATIATEVQNIKEHPPTAGRSLEEDPYVKALNVHLEAARDESKSSREAMREQAKDLRGIITDERKEHKRDMERLEDKLRDAERERGRHTGEGYKSDEIKFASEGMHRLADVLERKKPLEVIARFAAPEEGKAPPERERIGKSGILEKVPKELVD